MKRDRGTFRLRRRLVLGLWCAAVMVMAWKSFEIQVREADRWKALAEGQQRTSGQVAAARGRILDRNGDPLASSREVFSVAAAPQEVRDADWTAGRVATALGIPFEEARRYVAADRRWAVVPGRYGPEVREELQGIRGVYVERETVRSYPRRDLVRGLLGSVVDGRGAGGVEEVYDDLLRGEPGTRVVARGSDGEPIAGESRLVRPPRPGGEVVLTLDRELQEIAQHALGEAVEETGADGGDVLVSRPRTGEILAMASHRSDGTAYLPAITATYEPGSTLKPFTLAGLLREDLATLEDEVDVEGGRWTVHGRTISDVEIHDTLTTVTLRDALRMSSNVGVARAAERMTEEQHYEILRDFGFGVPTGLNLPGEAGGLLRRPEAWSRQSPASLAIGYELGATPLQMVMAYGALANDGELMEPRFVREVRDPDGDVREHHEPRAVRRVVEPEVAAELRYALAEAVSDGTGQAADLGTVAVAGKTGTTRAHGPMGYGSGGYQASFVGLFPVEDPELVVYVRLDRPQGEYYGGATAAPVSRAVMEAVVASRHGPVQRRALAAPSRVGTTGMGYAAWAGDGSRDLGGQEPSGAADGDVAHASHFVSLEGTPAGYTEGEASPPLEPSAAWAGDAHGLEPEFQLVSSSPPAGSRVAPPESGAVSARDGAASENGEAPVTVEVPEVHGASLRGAVRVLHAHGLRAEVEGGEGPFTTLPEPGTEVSRGDTIRVVGEGER